MLFWNSVYEIILFRSRVSPASVVEPIALSAPHVIAVVSMVVVLEVRTNPGAVLYAPNALVAAALYTTKTGRSRKFYWHDGGAYRRASMACNVLLALMAQIH